MIISGYGRKLPQFRGMNCTEPATFSQKMACCADYFTTILHRTFLGFSLLRHGCEKKKVLCCLHSLCLLESCIRNIGRTRIKKVPEYCGQNTNLNPPLLLLGAASPSGREGRGLCSTHPGQAGPKTLPEWGAHRGCRGGVGCRWKRVPRPHQGARCSPFEQAGTIVGEGFLPRLASAEARSRRTELGSGAERSGLAPRLRRVSPHCIFCVPLWLQAVAPNSESPSAK